MPTPTITTFELKAAAIKLPSDEYVISEEPDAGFLIKRELVPLYPWDQHI